MEFGHLEGVPQPDPEATTTITMVINHGPPSPGMILQVLLVFLCSTEVTLKFTWNEKKMEVWKMIFLFNLGDFCWFQPLIFTGVASCKLTVRHGKNTILMVFTRKDGDFHGLC